MTRNVAPGGATTEVYHTTVCPLPTQTPNPENSSAYGLWMFVSRKPRRVDKGKERARGSASGKFNRDTGAEISNGGKFDSLQPVGLDENREPIEEQAKEAEFSVVHGEKASMSVIYKGRRPNVQIIEKEIANASRSLKPTPKSKG